MLVGCNQSDELLSDVISIQGYDTLYPNNQQSMNYSDFYFIELKGTSEYPLTNIQRVEFLDSLMIIQDVNGLYAYNASGDYLWTYGKKGHGPGEYLQVSSFVVNKKNKTVAVVDAYTENMIVYDCLGNYKNKIKLDNGFANYVYRMDYIDEHTLFSNNFVINRFKDTYKTFNLDTHNVNVIDEMKMKMPSSGERFGYHPYNISGQNVCLVTPFSDSIKTVSEGKLSTAYKIVTDKEIYNFDKLAEIEYSTMINQKYVDDDDVFVGFSDIFETSSHLILQSFKYFTFVVDKSTWTGKRIMSPSIDGDTLTSLPLVDIISTKDDYLVGLTTLSSLELWDINSKKDGNLRKLEQYIYDNVSDDYTDRYILLFYKL